MYFENNFENVLNHENKLVPNIRALLIRENIFSTICLKKSSEKIYFHEASFTVVVITLTLCFATYTTGSQYLF